MLGGDTTCAPEKIVTGRKTKQFYNFQPRAPVSLLFQPRAPVSLLSARKTGWSSRSGMLFLLPLWV